MLCMWLSPVVKTTVGDFGKDTTRPEHKLWLITPPASVFIWMPQQLYPPSALINACLWDSALQPSPPRWPSRWPPPSSSHPEVLYWCDRTRLDRPGHGGTDGRSEGAIKVSFFTVFINSWWCWGEPLPIMGSLQPLTSVNRAGQLSASAWAGPMRALH